MNADETIINRDDDPYYGRCAFCGKDCDDHETACPHHPDTDNLVYQQLREPWTEGP